MSQICMSEVHTVQNGENKWTKILTLETTIFGLKIMVKSGLFFILKSYVPLQRYLLTCQANSAFLGRFFCTGQQQLRRGMQDFKIKNRPLFTIIFKPKMVISRVKTLVHLFSPFQTVCAVYYQIYMPFLEYIFVIEFFLVTNINLGSKTRYLSFLSFLFSIHPKTLRQPVIFYTILKVYYDINSYLLMTVRIVRQF